MTKVSIFPVVENLVKGNMPLYGFVPADAPPPYIVYEESGQKWSFPDIRKRTITFTLKVISTYKGPQEINRMTAFLKDKLEGREVSFEAHGPGLFRFIRQDIELKNDAITREAVLEFQLLVWG